ncbi:TetR/AcrR family transcriptional regulator [Lysinibacillus fusiformis]|uniref:TetR/AcrR family transcriptional regulator n=1 Tax=Lysinibacillus fusiformis TaxID=28031 RepID=UPI0004D77B3B|nr:MULTISPECIES: TetR/AcrR family transcriptional regulator [Lysinibacillus]KEK12617.1 TetR family transcriptional regulator [Lysinibacillus sphaericus]KGA80771.1 TetR family transcriptional regulator [Lysinibacillus fusiformis]WRS96854.1 TetR/AcrR family transcriptional regulator [Lysinibacillus fusiformis]
MQVTRDDWIKAALQQLAEDGIHKVRIEALARSLNISKGSFYHYFRDHQELLDAMLDYWETHATKAIIESMEQEGATLEQLLRISFHKDKKIEMGIYAWSKYDAHVATRIVRIEEQRIDCVAKLYQKKGMDGEQAIDRARLAYLSYVGWMTRYEANPHFDLEKMVKLLL